jgi:hypothetical protein
LNIILIISILGSSSNGTENKLNRINKNCPIYIFKKNSEAD